jgi:hypothetical protein
MKMLSPETVALGYHWPLNQPVKTLVPLKALLLPDFLTGSHRDKTAFCAILHTFGENFQGWAGCGLNSSASIIAAGRVRHSHRIVF